MSNRDDLLKMLKGQGKPDKIPYITNGFWNESAIHKFAPAECYDENTYYIPQDNPPREAFSDEPRSMESRERAVRMTRWLDMCTIGVGKGGVFPFGHGGPGEIQPHVIERTPEFKVLEYEGGHKRRINFHPHSIAYYDFPIHSEKDLERLQLPDMRNPERFRDVAKDADYFKTAGFVPTGSIQGFFSGIHNSFMDFQNTMENIILNPDFIKQVTATLARMSLDAAEMLLDRGVEIINVCDDLGNRDGLLLSPEMIREFFLPWYRELVSLTHGKGGYVHLHSHGNIASILPDLIETGIDMLNPFDWDENPDLPSLVKKYGSQVIFVGGCVGDLYLLPTDEAARCVRRACGLARIAEKGYIYMGGEGVDEMSLTQWNAMKEMIARARE